MGSLLAGRAAAWVHPPTHTTPGTPPTVRWAPASQPCIYISPCIAVVSPRCGILTPRPRRVQPTVFVQLRIGTRPPPPRYHPHQRHHHGSPVLARCAPRRSPHRLAPSHRRPRPRHLCRPPFGCVSELLLPGYPSSSICPKSMSLDIHQARWRSPLSPSLCQY